MPLALLKEEQERIGRSLRNVAGRIETLQAEHTEISQNLNDVFELLDDCGKAYSLAGDYEKRCFNQALFEKILVHDDLTLTADYSAPYDAIFDSGILEMRGECRNLYYDKVQTHAFFTSMGLSMDNLVRLRGLEPPPD